MKGIVKILTEIVKQLVGFAKILIEFLIIPVGILRAFIEIVNTLV